MISPLEIIVKVSASIYMMLTVITFGYVFIRSIMWQSGRND